ncbi:serine/threonine protein kinase [Pyxidicoccus parkwayensis]|uniref:Serine/threonine protein kinase n=1 Tax=Pyxidicoccus parkwayensis TaxID=2813578 RepID=A0ABX7NV01_9BACT|nr:serine/threonine-protein kinase [Pyxidicoccus parkwaysis]QSQ22751.1 serine/threonine protein kinase [Pyxidicoccus parkwaysis]
MASDVFNPARLLPGMLIGPWRLLELRGRGSFGIVFRAVHALQQDAEAVALKLAVNLWDARFAREAELLSRIHHPAVPRLLDHGHWQPRQTLSFPWLVMEWVEGLPLYEWAYAQRPSSRQVLQLLARLARALDATHSAGGLHRDVKGENILVRHSDAQPFLTDFGSGHFLGAATLTLPAFPPGTLAYRSPEAWRYIPRSGKIPAVPYSPRPGDDLFALGVTAYRLVTGKYPPVPNPEVEEAWLWLPEEHAHWTARVCNARCIPELSALVSRMLSLRPDARGSAREVAEALEQAARRAGREADVPLFTGEEPRPAGLFPRPQHVTVQRPPRPHRLPWLAAAGLGGALALSVAAFLSVSRSEQPATPQLAEQEESEAAEEPAMPQLAEQEESEEEEELAMPQLAEREESEEAKDGGTVAVGDTALTARVAPEHAPSVLSPIAVDVPPKPFPWQRRPDGSGRCPNKVQVAINGGCWLKVSVDQKDCGGAEGFEYRGACYTPVVAPPRPATSGLADRDGGS